MLIERRRRLVAVDEADLMRPKEMISLQVDYRLSPRGQVCLEANRSSAAASGSWPR